MWTLVTGGSRRLGASICLTLAEKGFPIVVHYHQSEKEALNVVEQCQAKGVLAQAIQGDFSSTDRLNDFIRQYLNQFPETVNVINNVGEYKVCSALKTSPEEWLYLFQMNLHTPFILSRALAPSLIRHQGQIINIGVSGLHRHAANTYAAAYTITKEGLWSLTRSLARELAPQGVRCNMVSPGELDISVDHYLKPMHRPANCGEISRVIAFLLDPESSYITGQNIEVAGGLGLS